MCGIAGILEFETGGSGHVEQVRAMQSALSHRGPDGSGLYESPTTNTVIAHSRLAIIALGDEGHQPMSLNQERYWITFNGEIYNHHELRSWLKSQGISCQTASDTEIILQLYALEGSQCVNRLTGMFAFVIWDNELHTGFAARDQMGIKPLYYYSDGSRFFFASELRALLTAGAIDKTLHKESSYWFFRTGTVPEPATLIKGVKLLSAGCSLEVTPSSLKCDTYWQPNFSSLSSTPLMEREVAVKITRQALIESIKRHLVSDVPVGLFLSGGIDSSALLALASETSGKPLRTFSIAFEDPRLNEGNLAKRVAKHFGAHHTEIVMTAENAKPLFHRFLKDIDQPTIDGFNTYCVSKLAADNGIKVCLSGLGADELFGGYKSFSLVPKAASYSRSIAFIGPAVPLIERLFGRVLSPKIKRLLDTVRHPGSLKAAHKSLRGIFSHTEAQQLADMDYIEKKDETCGELADADCVSQIELSTYLRNQLLRDSDVMSMAWGLELRVPFIDSELIETLLRIPSSHRISAGKQLLVDAVPEIPEWIHNRPKQGFVFPFNSWFGDSWNDIKTNTEPPSWMPLKPWYRRWSVTVLDNWIEQHLGPRKG